MQVQPCNCAFPGKTGPTFQGLKRCGYVSSKTIFPAIMTNSSEPPSEWALAQFSLLHLLGQTQELI